jgi:hypothetical protein
LKLGRLGDIELVEKALRDDAIAAFWLRFAAAHGPLADVADNEPSFLRSCSTARRRPNFTFFIWFQYPAWPEYFRA